MRVAIIHYWLVGMRGGERVLEQICRLYPDADIYTHVCIRENLSPYLQERRIFETSVARWPFARRKYQWYLAMMPGALEELDLTGYDLIISSEAGPAKGVIAPPGVPHICYCHSPMRYVWDQYYAYRAGLGPARRFAFSRVAARMRMWDVISANRVDHFVANSNFIAERIWRCYRREATVVHPPVNLAAFRPAGPPVPEGGYHLFASQLVPYKRVDIAIEAFGLLGLPLKIVGEGSDGTALRRTAPKNVEFLGRVSDDEMAELYRNCRALIFPGLEDFGIVPLEAMACGRPVIAYGRGGALDTVRHGETGILFDPQTPEALADAVRRFEDGAFAFDPAKIAAHARRFGEADFRAGMARAIASVAPDLAPKGFVDHPPA